MNEAKSTLAPRPFSKFAWGVLGHNLLVVQLGAGVLNVFLLAPVWMQLLHLFLADVVWITFILFSFSFEKSYRII